MGTKTTLNLIMVDPLTGCAVVKRLRIRSNYDFKDKPIVAAENISIKHIPDFQDRDTREFPPGKYIITE